MTLQGFFRLRPIASLFYSRNDGRANCVAVARPRWGLTAMKLLWREHTTGVMR